MVANRQHPLAARIKGFLKADEDVGRINNHTPAVLGAAVEQLIHQLCLGAAALAAERGAGNLTSSHLKAFILAEPKLDFLKDLVKDVPELPAVDAEGQPPAKRPRQSKAAKDAAQGAAKGRASKAAKLASGASSKVKAEAAAKLEDQALPAEPVDEQVLAVVTAVKQEALSSAPDSNTPDAQGAAAGSLSGAIKKDDADAASAPATVNAGSAEQPDAVPAAQPIILAPSLAAQATFDDEDDYDAE